MNWFDRIDINSDFARFGDVNENEVYLFSTFLDPVLGIKAFDSQMKTIVRNKLITLLQVESIKEILKEKKLIQLMLLK